MPPENPLRNMLSRMRVFSNWYNIELVYAGIRKPGIDVKTWGGSRIHTRDSGDLAHLDEVICGRAYDQEPCRIPVSGVIVDVGAHLGSFSLYSVFKRKAKRVVSCEPCPDNLKMLRMNVKSNRLDDVITVVPKAVSGKHELRTFYLSNSNTGGNSLFGDANWLQGDIGSTFQVECLTLKEVLDDNGIDQVDFLKLDCEGAEIDILQNIDEHTSDRVNMIGMEFHNYPREWFVSRLQELGFSVFPSKKPWRNRVYIIASK